MVKQEIFKLLESIPDPEIPVLSIIDLGVVRDAFSEGKTAVITITPTYTGCPAMKMIEEDIITLLKKNGFEEVKVNTVLSPAWTTDWISDGAREKLRQYGIAPPSGTADKNSLFGSEKVVRCPRCGSVNTVMLSQFGSTACKALYQCRDCQEPFDYFKCI